MRGRSPAYDDPSYEDAVKGYDLKLMRRLFRYLRPQAGLVALSLLALMIGSVLQLAGPYLTKIAIDDYIMPGRISGLHVLALLYLGSVCLSFLFQYLKVYLLQLTGQRIMLKLRKDVFDRLLGLPLPYYDRTPVGRLVTRAIQDIEVINELFTQGVVILFGDLVTMAAIMGVLFWMNWKLSLVIFLIAPLVVVATAFYRVKARDAYRRLRGHLARLNAYLQENLVGMTTVQTFIREEDNFRRFDELNRETNAQHIRAIVYSSLFFPCVEVIGASAVAMIIWLGGGMVIQDVILPGVLVAFIQYLRRFFQPVREIAEKYNLLQAAMAASERVFELMDTPLEVRAPAEPQFPESQDGDIRFENVWFSYNPGEWILKGVDFHIRPGETTALVGVTGAGKSTLIGLLGRTYACNRGRIVLDGVEIRNRDVEGLRKYVGVVPQDVFFFAGPLMENLRLWDDTIPEDRVRRTAEYLGVDRLIEQLPGGYGMNVRERGENLSLGQRQLLAFVRVLLYAPRIIVLDEATSSVDPESERLIQRAVAKLISGRTSLIIAHRLSTIRNVDRILVLHGGKIREEGAHDELLALNGIYRRLYRFQLKSDITDPAEQNEIREVSRQTVR